MLVDSKKQLLNIGQIIPMFLHDNPQEQSFHVMLAGIMTELSHPQVKTKQIGNTLFEVIIGTNGVAFMKTYNVDTGVNFMDNAEKFAIYAKEKLGLKTLVSQFVNPQFEHALKIIFKKPPMAGMSYQLHQLPDGETQLDLHLGAL